jgi:hypothetical protein
VLDCVQVGTHWIVGAKGLVLVLERLSGWDDVATFARWLFAAVYLVFIGFWSEPICRSVNRWSADHDPVACVSLAASNPGVQVDDPE